MEDSASSSRPTSTTFRGGIPTQNPSQGRFRSFITPEVSEEHPDASLLSGPNLGNFRQNVGSSARSAPTRTRQPFASRTPISIHSVPTRTSQVGIFHETLAEMVITPVPLLVSGLPE